MNKLKELWNKSKIFTIISIIGISLSIFGLIKVFFPKKQEAVINPIEQQSLTKSINDSITREYIKLANINDELKIQSEIYQRKLNQYQTSNNLLKQELLKRRTNNETKINYLDVNASIEASLDTISRVISRNPIKIQNR